MLCHIDVSQRVHFHKAASRPLITTHNRKSSPSHESQHHGATAWSQASSGGKLPRQIGKILSALTQNTCSRFINSKNPVGSLDKYDHPPRSKRIDLNHTLQTIPETAPRQHRRQPKAEIDEYAEYYDDGDQVSEQEMQQPANTGDHGRQQYRREDYLGFQTAGQYKPDQVQRAVRATATKQSSFKPVITNKTNIPSQPNNRSYQPTNAGHGRPASRSGHIGGIQSMSGNFGAPTQPVRSPPRARLAGSGQGGQQNRVNGQFGSRQGGQGFKYQQE